MSYYLFLFQFYFICLDKVWLKHTWSRSRKSRKNKTKQNINDCLQCYYTAGWHTVCMCVCMHPSVTLLRYELAVCSCRLWARMAGWLTDWRSDKKPWVQQQQRRRRWRQEQQYLMFALCFHWQKKLHAVFTRGHSVGVGLLFNKIESFSVVALKLLCI